MPFGTGAFDLVVCRSAFKNFRAPAAALDELYRVLRPGGEAVIIDLRPDLSRQAIADEVRRMRLDPINGLLTRLIFRLMLTRRAYPREHLENLAARSRFGSAEILELPISYQVRLRKQPADPPGVGRAAPASRSRPAAVGGGPAH
jgi:ubiquinone/menaquinone biosynthesis C-methylase UbiE